MHGRFARQIPALALGLGVVVAVAAGGPARAQESASYRQTERVLNSGGTPAQGVEVASAGYRVTLSSLGGGLYPGVGAGAGADLPPGEVAGLLFTAPQTLVWDPEPSAGTYNVYRAAIATLDSGAFGDCLAPGGALPSATDPAEPAAGAGFFYLVTVENRLREEGTKGAGRGGTFCP